MEKAAGRESVHNGHVPKSHWLSEWAIGAIVAYRRLHRDEGYRHLSYMMLDEDLVTVSPSSVYQVLKHYDLHQSAWRHAKTKGGGFQQPKKPLRSVHFHVGKGKIINLNHLN